MWMLVLTWLTFKKVKFIFGHLVLMRAGLWDKPFLFPWPNCACLVSKDLCLGALCMLFLQTIHQLNQINASAQDLPFTVPVSPTGTSCTLSPTCTLPDSILPDILNPAPIPESINKIIVKDILQLFNNTHVFDPNILEKSSLFSVDGGWIATNWSTPGNTEK